MNVKMIGNLFFAHPIMKRTGTDFIGEDLSLE